MSTDLTYDDVARILAMLDMAEGEDLDVTLGGLRIAVTSWQHEAMAAPAETPAHAKQEDRAGRQAPAAGQSPTSAATGLIEARAPRPGRYRALVDADAAVREGEVLGEVVGLAGSGSEVLAPGGGRLVELCVGEGEFVEYGQIIAVIERATQQQGRPVPPVTSGQTA